jgi:hypothetical protein
MRDMKRHSLWLRNPRNPSQYHMKTCHKGKLGNRNVGSKDQGTATKIYAKFTSMPFISLISPPVLRIFWPNSIFLRNYIIPGWNLRIFCKFLKLLSSLVLQLILKVQRVLCFSDGTRSIFWDISIWGKSTSSSCLWPLLLFHCW